MNSVQNVELSTGQHGIARFGAEYHGRANFTMALGNTFHFLSAEFPHEFPFLSTKFSFSERRILGGLFSAPLQFLGAKFPFSEHKISIFEGRMSIFSVEFAFSECRILADLFRAVFEGKICIFCEQNSYF